MSYARKPQPVDAIVVGVGASGATAAKVLCEAGLKVVGFDKGPLLRPAEHFSGDELKFVNRNYLWPDPKISPRTVRDDADSRSEIFPFSPCPQLVGGGTNHWAGWLPRPRESDFIQRSLHGDLPGASLADWPIRYEHLEPYLTKVEWEFGCAGIAGADQTEGFRSKPYPSEPLPPTRFGKQFYEACKKLGINAFPLPHALVANNHKGRNTPRQNWTGFWNQYGDPGTTRSNALTTFVPPTDHDPGAREARCVRFIDRYLSGIEYIYAAADGSGFLQLSGRLADAWRARICDMQDTYRQGIRQLDEIAQQFGGPFKALSAADQDRVLELLSGQPKPEPVSLGRDVGVRTFLQGLFDEGLGFFDTLCLHTRQGFYSDPVYGGNRDQVGWKVVGFPGPKSLKETNDLTYSVREYFVLDYDWKELVPRLKELES